MSIARRAAGIALAFAVAVSVLAPASVQADPAAEPQQENVLFADDFENGVNERWSNLRGMDENVVNIVDDGTGNHAWQVRGPWPHADVEKGNESWQDYTVEADFTVQEWLPDSEYGGIYDGIALMGRLGANNDSWSLQYRKSGVFELNKYYNNLGHAILTAPYTMEIGKTYTLKLVFEGEQITAYVAEKGQEYTEPMFTYQDSGEDKVTHGGVAIDGGYSCTLVDNFRVTGTETEKPKPELPQMSLSHEQIFLSVGDYSTISPVIEEGKLKDWAEYGVPVVYTSSDACVSVDEDGTLHANAPGTAVITATVEERPIGSCTVTVSPVCTTFLYVAPWGRDGASGTEEDPFATIEQARDSIRGMESLPEGGVTVYLRSGSYYVEESIVFTPEDSGEEGKPIVYASYPGEQASINSGRHVTGFKLLTENFGALPENARGNVYVADVEKGVRFHDIYADGVCQQVARQTNSDDWKDWKKLKPGHTCPVKGQNQNGMPVTFQDGDLENIPTNGDVEVNYLPVPYWNSLVKLSDIDAQADTANMHTFATIMFREYFGYHEEYNIMNAAKYLDEPGEWCVDTTEGKLYWWPGEGVDPAKGVTVPVSTELIRLQGSEENEQQPLVWDEQVKFLEFRDLTFEYVDRSEEDTWGDPETKETTVNLRNAENPFAMIYMQGVDNCAVIDCTLRFGGAYGITVNHYGQNVRVVGCDIEEMGSGGIYLQGYGPGYADVNKLNTIMMNRVSTIGRFYMHSSGVTLYNSGNNNIKLNRFENLPYTATQIVGALGRDIMLENLDTYGPVDTYGNSIQNYSPRIEDLEDIREKYPDQYAKFNFNYSTSERSVGAMPWIHARNNVVEYNSTEEYMLTMNDGGCYYFWATGYNNQLNNNLVRKSTPDKGWNWPLYIDDAANYTLAMGNVAWGDHGFYDFGALTHRWEGVTVLNNVLSTQQTPEYTALKNTIDAKVEALGGYRSTPELFETVFVVDGTEQSVYTTVGGTIRMPADPQKEGYSFLGWFTQPQGGEKVEQFTAAQTVYAQFEPLPRFEVRVENGTADPASAYAGQQVTLTADAPAEGMHFVRWEVEGAAADDAQSPVTSFVMPQKDVTARAVFEKDVQPTATPSPTETPVPTAQPDPTAAPVPTVQPTQQPAESQPEALPQTGDASLPLALAGVMISAALAAILLGAHKRRIFHR